MMRQKLADICRYSFSPSCIDAMANNPYASNHWPLVYVLSDGKRKLAYVGETTDALTRISTHLKHDEKGGLTAVHLIGSEKFNKSATLDVESSLIKYMSADGKFSLLNGNLGLLEHNYYQKNDLYAQIFKSVWDELRREGVVEHSLEHISNSDLFKYSPYKSLSADQRQGLMGIMYALLDDSIANLVVQGGAGTGKSILAIFLFKMLHSDASDLNFKEFSADEVELRKLTGKLKARYPAPKMALVVPMTSFRNTLKKAFSHIAGLSSKMVISPSELAKEAYDIVLVDESHRLRKRVNLGAYFGTFDKASAALGFDKQSCSEVDWVCKQASKAVFFYDESQSIKPSDVDTAVFLDLKAESTTQVQTLVSQFRVRGGNPYVDFVHKLLHQGLTHNNKFTSKKYELRLCDSIDMLVRSIQEKNEKFGLARLVAGYAWPWISRTDKNAFDIVIENTRLKWNSTNTDWINSSNSDVEVGCIHTTQGYDLNYVGVIFGHEITYNKAKDKIHICENRYFDRNGKQSIKDPNELKQYILNIYKTIMLRGIKGTYVYACDEGLRDYLARYIPAQRDISESGVSEAFQKLEPQVSSVPLYDLQVAAGDFSSQQSVEQSERVAVPDDVQVSKNLFACRVVGESMNRVIPNGSLCLFRRDPGGSRNGKIVLVESDDGFGDEIGSRYTVKEYESIKSESEDGWEHTTILLKPLSDDPAYEPIELSEELGENYKVIGEFVQVLD